MIAFGRGDSGPATYTFVRTYIFLHDRTQLHIHNFPVSHLPICPSAIPGSGLMHFSSEVHNLGTEKSVSQLVILRNSVFSISMDGSSYPAAPAPVRGAPTLPWSLIAAIWEYFPANRVHIILIGCLVGRAPPPHCQSFDVRWIIYNNFERAVPNSQFPPIYTSKIDGNGNGIARCRFNANFYFLFGAQLGSRWLYVGMASETAMSYGPPG